MEIRDFLWDEWNIAHIARHKVDPCEVEEIAFDDDPHIRKEGTARYLYGQTVSGRYLFTVYVLRSKIKAWVVTSRDMDEGERRLYKHWKAKRGI
jgi:hypothetical protein